MFSTGSSVFLGTSMSIFFMTIGIATRKMMSKTRTTSTSGVTLMSLRTRPFAPPPPNAMLLLLQFLRRDLDLLGAGCVHRHQHRIDVSVLQIGVRLEEHGAVVLAPRLLFQTLLEVGLVPHRVAVPPH